MSTSVAHPDHPVRIFTGSIVFFLVTLVIGFIYGGVQGLVLVALLGVMELSLSFDNAIINSRIVEKLSDRWRFLFLTIGVAVAVFGMRLVFPLLIVGVTTGLNPVDTFSLALEKGSIDEPGSYAYVLHEAHPDIAAFGGIFLLMLFLDWLFDPERDIHWLRWIEAPLAKLGKIDIASVVFGLLGLVVISQIAHEHTERVLLSGVIGMIVYLAVKALGDFFEDRLDSDDEDAPKRSGANNLVRLTGKAAFFSFIYLEVLDASFSFDGVIGAFAITADPIIIALGLGAGAMFVRSLTIFLVKKGTLNEYVFLEHGAHWAIGILAGILITSIEFEIPEVVTGLIGVALIVAAFISSVAYNRKEAKQAVEDTIHAGAES